MLIGAETELKLGLLMSKHLLMTPFLPGLGPVFQAAVSETLVLL